MKTLRQTFGQRVQKLRADVAISQEDFAARCGFARSYMSRIERGTSNLSLEGIERVAEGFGISVGDLMTGL